MYCTWIENGEWIKQKGECGATPTDTSPDAPASPSEGQPTENVENEMGEDSELPTEGSEEPPAEEATEEEPATDS